jgi:hypothetical protein
MLPSAAGLDMVFHAQDFSIQFTIPSHQVHQPLVVAVVYVQEELGGFTPWRAVKSGCFTQ